MRAPATSPPRVLSLAAVLLAALAAGCPSSSPPADAVGEPDAGPRPGDAATPRWDSASATPIDAAPADAPPPPIGDAAPPVDGAGVGEPCDLGPAGLDAGGRPCRSDLACCYPCGIPDCLWTCQVPCDPATPACVDGCLAVP